MGRPSIFRFCSTSQRGFLAVFLLVFMVRAMIPAGYMPVAQHERFSGFALSLCITGLSPAAIQTLSLDDGAALTEHPEHSCVFGSVLGSGGPPTEPQDLQWPMAMVAVAVAMPQVAALPAWVVRGPPLGSRAPPRV